MNKITGGNALIDPTIIIEKAGIADTMAVADLGCGATGHFVFPIAKVVGKHGVIYAVDILKSVLANIERRAKQENLEQVKTVWSNLEIFKATAIEAASLDVAMLINVLYQSDKRIEMLREAVRMTKAGGTVLIVDWNSAATPFGPSLAARVNRENLKAAAVRLGLELKEEFDAGMYHFGITFIKH